MAHAALDLEALSCPICLDILKDPVTVPCGHSYCMSCIQTHWDQNRVYSCPQCRESFIPRPVLVKSTVLAHLVEQLKKTGLTGPPADCCPAGPGDVACDSCTETKLRAVKSCLQCLASYCETHIQPHYHSAAFQTHQLMAPSHHLQDYTCSVHHRVKDMFCRSDQQCICYLCSMDHHQGHDTVSAAAEMADSQRALEDRKDQLLQTIQDTETHLQRLGQEAQALRHSAQEALQHSEESFTRMVLLLKQRQSEVERQIRSQLETGEAKVCELQDQLQQNITELKTTLDHIDSLSLIEDHSHFLHRYQSLSRETPERPQIHTSPGPYFQEVTTAVSELSDKVQLALTEGLTNVSLFLHRVQDLLPHPEPGSREEFLQFSREITLDPNTTWFGISLSDGNRRATVREKWDYPDHPDRFSYWDQVLSREALSGRCYWEVEWHRCVRIAVAYRDMKRKGCSKLCRFGDNNKSWALESGGGTSFWFNSVKTQISGQVGHRIGVYLDHDAGVLSFYSVKDQTMNVVYRVQTTFTQPLHVGLGFGCGLWVDFPGDTVHFPKLK